MARFSFSSLSQSLASLMHELKKFNPNPTDIGQSFAISIFWFAAVAAFGIIAFNGALVLIAVVS